MRRVFVGTLHCGENEFADCVTSIALQKNVSVTHVIVHNREEKQAHDELWSAWNGACLQHDVFVKVDADTLLRDENTLEKICDLFSQRDINYAQFYLFDFFTQENINGLNCYRKGTILNSSNNNLFADRVAILTHNVRVLTSQEAPESLTPAGYHCSNPSNKQAFHWGLRRMLKGDMHAIERLTLEYQKIPSIQRQYALLGVWASKKFKDGGWNYDDRLFNELYKNAESLVSSQ